MSFVDSKVVETDAVIDEEEGFMEVVEAEKKVEEKRVSSKYPPGKVSGTIYIYLNHTHLSTLSPVHYV